MDYTHRHITSHVPNIPPKRMQTFDLNEHHLIWGTFLALFLNWIECISWHLVKCAIKHTMPPIFNQQPKYARSLRVYRWELYNCFVILGIAICLIFSSLPKRLSFENDLIESAFGASTYDEGQRWSDLTERYYS